ncbi:formimidoylglutamate deiminase [Acidisoma cellulosilytica]|uniref:Formimidoylglutamate deiminase n=1 Tax=Acidisoma cellulosilyticum TaxID=2802395 RepID=A0A963Z4Y7_9PROT|nr:formimidoylglutamate deiminase [Acidisoma cellulosilyticum]MCB8882862.1 formimidoylglutamate deiminase [Acidisoma cellulosilyticum]
MPCLLAPSALLPSGWARNVRIDILDDGTIGRVTPDAEPIGDRVELLAGPVVPGMPNVHSHAFQRAMAGLAEKRRDPADSFWTWREMMYRAAHAVRPDDLSAIADYLFIEMLKAGYTTVGEFHYLHNDSGGAAYADPAEMSGRLVRAAADTGIGLTVLPVLYMRAGFDGAPLEAAQRRFATNEEQLLNILESLRWHGRDSTNLRVGIAPHSLRAVSVDVLRHIASALPEDTTIHIHVAEQMREVEDCIAATGSRPVELLMAEAPVGPSWCLIHATHVLHDELADIAASGAVAGLCPITEGNLGDGVFPLPEFLTTGGRFGIGSDSNVTLNPWEELRLLEYGQRLTHGRRCMSLPEDASGSVGGAMYRAALTGGAAALGQPVGVIAEGFRADLTVLDRNRLSQPDAEGDDILDSAIFTGSSLPVRDVMVGGIWRVREGYHPQEQTARAAFAAALRRIAA